MLKNFPNKISFLFILFSLVLCGNLNATHLVGGEISYQCLGNDNYAIKLRVYRDCAPGSAQFDAFAIITVFDINDNVIENLSVAKGPTIPISGNPTNDPCITIPAGLCTEYAEYHDTVKLLPLAGGYVITHQRCCRNNTITNIANSGTWGNTYTVTIVENDSTCNSSPQFIGNGPSVICIGENLYLPITATDADGDSLFFEFCNIFAGGGQGGGACNSPVPNPACPPPYTIIPFDPPYTSSEPLPANPKFKINGKTGIITGKPNAIGQFVVGICVSEYRKGVKLSTVRLDYQFNVANCGQPIAKIETELENPTMLCDGLTVTFTSLSTGVNGLLWIFGNPPFDTSTAATPTVVFPAPGPYVVTLVVNPGLTCGDTVQQIFNVKETVDVELDYTGIPCFEVQGLEFTPNGYFHQGSVLTWNFGPYADIQTSNQINPPPITWSLPGIHPISLIISWNGGLCQKTFLDTIEISNLSASVDAGPDQTVSYGDIVQLNATGGSTYYWSSDLPASFSDNTNPQATTLPKFDTTTYYIEVYDEFGCKGVDSMQVFIERIEAFMVMNVITPNDDGKNDYLDLGVLFEEGDICSISVINRWGKEVYNKPNYQNDFAGIGDSGQKLEDGTYYFILKCGDQIRFRGPVTIMSNKQ